MGATAGRLRRQRDARHEHRARGRYAAGRDGGLPGDTQSGARAAGPFPFIVELTPYLRLGQPVGVMPYFVERGYIHAVVRPRGTGGSTGQMQQFTWEPLFCDGPNPPHSTTFSAGRVFGTLPLYFSAWVRAYT